MVARAQSLARTNEERIMRLETIMEGLPGRIEAAIVSGLSNYVEKSRFHELERKIDALEGAFSEVASAVSAHSAESKVNADRQRNIAEWQRWAAGAVIGLGVFFLSEFLVLARASVGGL